MERKLPDWMRTLQSTSKNTNDENIETDRISNVIARPLLIFKGKVRYSNQIGVCGIVCEAILEKLKTLKELVVGFDLEWPVFSKSGGQGRTALIQLCPSEKVCYLFHVTEWHRLPKVLIDFISHPKVRLVGINVRGDIWKLGRDFDISVASIVQNNAIELRSVANQVFSTQRGWSLDRIVLYVLKKELNKSSDVRTSNWAQEILTGNQLCYAATDAYASLLVYQRLKVLEVEIKNKNAATDACLESRSDELQRSPHNPDSSIESH